MYSPVSKILSIHYLMLNPVNSSEVKKLSPNINTQTSQTLISQ